MSPQELYEIWAPPESPWSLWAKPVLFAVMPAGAIEANRAGTDSALDVSWAPVEVEQTALILDLPGSQGVRYGVALAARGYRPVPLYNTTPGVRAVLDVHSLFAALCRGADALQPARLAANAPPAFLLDADRMGARQPRPGDYDNRWLVFAQDFPSARHLLAQGIRQIVLVSAAPQPQRDLLDVLYRWQRGGLTIAQQDFQAPHRLTTLSVPRPAHWRFWWYRALVLLGLRRNSAGGFGAIVPEPSSSSGGHFA